MKKVIAILTALVLAFSLTAVAYGAGSPEGKKVYDISVSGNVGVWPDVLYTVEEGETYDLSTVKELDGYVFVGWSIDGEYDVVSGDINSTKLTILPKSDIFAKAIYTQKVELKDDEFKVEYTHNIDGLEENYEIIKKGEEIELSAMEDLPGYAFVKWEIIGSYKIISGSLEDSDLVILPLGNVIVKQIFVEVEDEDEGEEPDEGEDDEDEDGEEGKKPPKGDTNDSDTSPETGMMLPIFGLFAALGTAVVSKKLSK